jgi:hypothetical protein
MAGRGADALRDELEWQDSESSRYVSPAGDSLRRPADHLAGFRKANDQIADSAEEQEVTVFACECGSQDCLGTVELSLSEYESIRTNPSWALVIPGHELENVERVVRVEAGFLVVERLLLFQPR